MNFRFAALGLGVIALVALTACTSKTTVTSSTTTQAGISVTGTGITTGAPDVVTLQLGVQADAKTVATARDNAAQAQQAVVAALKADGVADKDILTVQFTIDPQYSFANQSQTLTGYRVTNVVQAKVRKIETASNVVDDVTAAGGNNTVVRSIVFSIDDPTQLQAQARDLAMTDARSRADQLAKAGGVSLGKPISVTESGPTSQPFASAAIQAPATGSGVSTPIEAGNLQVRVQVTVVYAIE